MKQATKTIIEFCQKIFSSNQLEINGNKKVIFRIGYPSQKLDYNNKPFVVIDLEEDGKVRQFKLWQNDVFKFRHEISIKAVEDITKDHIFPITFKMDGQEYKLNRTKQNKLILTK